MKQSLFAVAIAVILLAAGCQKTEIMNQSGTSIGFATQTGKLTKAADAAGLETLKKYGFKVWAYRNYEDEFYNGEDAATNSTGVNAIYDGMNGTDILWDGSKWKTNKDYYWPGAERQLKFYAVASSEAFSLTPGENGSVAITHDSGNPKEAGIISVKDFIVTPEADNDLMVAEAVVQAQMDANNGNTVKPLFRHALTKVQFNFKTKEETVEEHPVYVLNIKTSALATKGTVSLTKGDEVVDWSDVDPEGPTHQFEDNNTEVVEIPKVKNENNQDVDPVIDGEPAGTPDRNGITLTVGEKPLDTWLLRPQDLENATVTITYIVKHRYMTKTVSLAATGLTKWAPNQFVKYNFTIAPNLITFEPEVEDWDKTDVVVDDRGSSVQTPPTNPTNQVNVTVGEESVVLYYYDEELAVGTEVYVKNESDEYVPAADGTYTLEDGSTLTVSGGCVAEITPAEPAQGE